MQAELEINPFSQASFIVLSYYRHRSRSPILFTNRLVCVLVACANAGTTSRRKNLKNINRYIFGDVKVNDYLDFNENV
jgi:hypothetical protein